MRTIIKHFIIDTVSLYLVSQMVTGIVFAKGIETIVLAGLVLMLVSLIVRPVINLLLLPINLITFGLFKWLGFAITLYIVTLVVPGFKLLDFVFNGFSSFWFSVPHIALTGGVAFIAFSFLISFISSIVFWIFK